MTEYTIYTHPEQAIGKENALVVRECPVCGDRLLGFPGKEYDGAAQCEAGHHGSRPGVFYRNGEVVEIVNGSLLVGGRPTWASEHPDE